MNLPAHAAFPPSVEGDSDAEPSRARRALLWLVAALAVGSIAWALLVRLDIVASAPGRMVPQSYVKIVQPAEAGIVRELLVRPGDHVAAGQVLARMDATIAGADQHTLEQALTLRQLQLRRIDAELETSEFVVLPDDPKDLVAQVQTQLHEHLQAMSDAHAEAHGELRKAEGELRAAREQLARIESTLPHFRKQETSYQRLASEGFFNPLTADDKTRERLDKEGELLAQRHIVQSLEAAIQQARGKLAGVRSGQRSRLLNERLDAEGDLRKLQGEVAKARHRQRLLELHAPQSGVIKDLASFTPGTVVTPASVLLTVVPDNEPLEAEVIASNDDAAWLNPGQAVKLKIAAYPFQQYGMALGRVRSVSPDAGGAGDAGNQGRSETDQATSAHGGYRVMVSIEQPWVLRDGTKYPLHVGMQVVAEVHLGTRTAMEYLLAPVRKVRQEALRER